MPSSFTTQARPMQRPADQINRFRAGFKVDGRIHVSATVRIEMERAGVPSVACHGEF